MSDEYYVIDYFIDDCMDLIDLRKSKLAGQDEPSVPLDEVIKELNKSRGLAHKLAHVIKWANL
jgi:hypothetical protein